MDVKYKVTPEEFVLLSQLRSKVPGTPCDGDSKTLQQKDSSQKEDGALVSKSRPVRLETPKVDHLAIPKFTRCLSSKQFDETEAILRSELLKSRFHSRQSEIDENKRYYSFNGAALITTTETTLALTRIALGTGTNQRLTGAVKLKRLGVKFNVYRYADEPGTVNTFGMPIITVVIWRVKVPSTPGTAPTIIGTGANPETSQTLMFSRLGQTAAVVPNSCAVRNPLTADLYHIYKIHHFRIAEPNFQYSTVATGLGLPAPDTKHFDWEIDLHDVQQDYGTTTSPQTNDIYMTHYSDMDYTNLGYVDNIQMTSYVTFRDVQD